MAELVNEMIALFVPRDAGGSTKTRDLVIADFMVRILPFFSIHSWVANCMLMLTLPPCLFRTITPFDKPLPHPVYTEQLEINSRAITIAEVISFVEETENVSARLRFIDFYGANNLSSSR